jgi:hypothetical protein
MLVSCKKEAEKESGISTEKMNISAITDQELASYVLLGEYKGLVIELGARSKDVAVWDEVASRAQVKTLPEQQVRYYFEQAKAQYEYYAQTADMSYEQILSELGTSEEQMLLEAQDLALGDILFELVRRAEGIDLTESEKAEHFERYVEKYVADYGYSTEYVSQNLKDLIYESMLYDKVTEFLISNNEIN